MIRISVPLRVTEKGAESATNATEKGKNHDR